MSGEEEEDDDDDEGRPFLWLRWHSYRLGRPRLVEAERALGDALVAVAARVHARVPAVQQLEQVVLRLIVGACVANLAHLPY